VHPDPDPSSNFGSGSIHSVNTDPDSDLYVKPCRKLSATVGSDPTLQVISDPYSNSDPCWIKIIFCPKYLPINLCGKW